jgi:hypothetical protein
MYDLIHVDLLSVCVNADTQLTSNEPPLSFDGGRTNGLRSPCMADDKPVDYYELLQVSTNAEPETINRTYRLLAQRYHPDNQTTGNVARFRELHEAYTVLSDPEQRARYDIVYQQHRQDRWRLVSAGVQSEDDFALEQMFRLTMLEALYTKRRTEPGSSRSGICFRRSW